MTGFWEHHFSTEQTSWGFEPADSALFAKDFFQKKDLKNILIPGIGYGRNAGIFNHDGFSVTGIEISPTAIQLARQKGFRFPIHQGSVLDMPFDNAVYDGIFCYAVLHLFNKQERKKLLALCYQQLKPGGYMIFTVVSTKAPMFGTGKLLSKNRYKVSNGLGVYFYDVESAIKEFSPFGQVECFDIDEPIKHMKNIEPLKCLLITLKKMP